MLIKWLIVLTVLGFQFVPEKDSPEEPFFKEDDVNEAKQEKSSSRVTQAVKEWCDCGKCEPMLTKRECRCCHEAPSHYWNGNIRGGSRNFASSKLEFFAINDSRLSHASDCHEGSKLDVRVFEFQPSLIAI